MKILNFGSLNIDYVYNVDHFVRPGETLSSDSLSVYSGGKGLNQSIALARAGAQVYHAGIAGKDGGFLLDILKESGVNTEYTKVSGDVNGHAIIQVDRKGQNCILLYGGTNQQITRGFVDEVFTGFQEGDWVLLQNEINETAYIMECARKKKMRIILNPSPMDDKILALPLDNVDLFILNEVEAAGLCGGKADESSLALLHGRFPGSSIVLTLGKAGAVYLGPEGILRHGIYRVPVVDTTAAGDTFTGYFISQTAAGEPPARALETASIASSLAVSKKGAAPSIPKIDEVLSSNLEQQGTVDGAEDK